MHDTGELLFAGMPEAGKVVRELNLFWNKGHSNGDSVKPNYVLLSSTLDSIQGHNYL